MDPKPSSTPPPVPIDGAALGEADPLIGAELLGRVRVVRLLARGGMGRVYRAEQIGLGRPCAVKVLDPRLIQADRAEFTRRFLLEASVAARISHPNVVTVFDYGEVPDGGCFLAMEYLDGRTLAEALKQGPMPPARAVHIGRQMCRALREAHALGVVHRDVKPGNVFLVRRDEDEDFVKVLDFGLVGEAHAPDGPEAHAGEVAIMGSPRYMAPEQVQGKATDARTDVYAVGAVLYAMLAGRPPFERATDLATMMAHVSDAPPPLASAAPGVPPELEALVMKCLAKDPEQRFASMDEMVAALRLEREPGPTATPGPHPAPPLLAAPGHADAAKGRAGRGAAPLVLGAFAVVGALVVAATSMRRAPPAPAAPPAGGLAMATPETAVVPPTTVIPPAPPPPAPTATVHLDTVPSGAKVKEEGETLCDATPCDVVFTGPGASPQAEHLIVFLKPSYKLERKLVTVGGGPLRVKLTPAR